MDDMVIPRNDSLISHSLTPEESLSSNGTASNKILDVVTMVNLAVICSVTFVFGTVSNIVNIIVFVRMGFKDPINISLFALAISDLGICFSLLIYILCFNPEFRKLDLPFDPEDFHFFPGWVHIIFTRITGIITAFITFERCLCVVAPLKVKEIFTAKRVKAFLVCSSLFVVGSIAMHFYTGRYVWRFVPERNRSILVLDLVENHKKLGAIPMGIHGIFIPFAAFFVVVISTIVLVFNLKQKTKWRESVTKSSASLSARDAKVSKTVLTIALLFIVCYIPLFIPTVAMLAAPQFHSSPKGNDMFMMSSFHFTLESINSSLNIFIYYRMSSAYRTVFLEMFGRKTSAQKSS